MIEINTCKLASFRLYEFLLRCLNVRSFWSSRLLWRSLQTTRNCSSQTGKFKVKIYQLSENHYAEGTYIGSKKHFSTYGRKKSEGNLWNMYSKTPMNTRALHAYKNSKVHTCPSWSPVHHIAKKYIKYTILKYMLNSYQLRKVISKHTFS